MRATCKVLLVLGVAALLTAPALAQGQRKGGGRGGMGMGGPAQLIANKSVQKEVNLTEEQVKKGQAIAKEVNDKHQSDREALRDLEGQEQFQKRMELGRTINEETYKALADVLKPEQIKRLKQIQLQRQGTFAFMSPDTQMELKLTDDQKDKIKTIGDDARQEMGAIFQEQDQAARQKKMAAFQKETMEKITAVLTDDQKKTWKEMTGEPFEYKPDPGEGFGGGRRGKKKDGV